MEQLLKILEDNARLPIEDIATMLNKSPAEVAAMIDLARAQGSIKGYKTLVDWEDGYKRQGQGCTSGSGLLFQRIGAGILRGGGAVSFSGGLFQCCLLYTSSFPMSA